MANIHNILRTPISQCRKGDMGKKYTLKVQMVNKHMKKPTL